MKRWLFPAVVLAAVALAIAAVGCSSSKSTKTNATSTPKKTAVSTPVATRAAQTPQGSTPRSTASSQTTPGAGATVIASQNAQLGKILTDASGRTLYKFKNDQQNVSTCTGTCAQAWPPLTIASGTPTAGAGVTGQLAVISRPDGNQVTLGGSPLYYFASDTAAGDAKGEGVGGFSVIKITG